MKITKSFCLPWSHVAFEGMKSLFPNFAERIVRMDKKKNVKKGKMKQKRHNDDDII